MNCCSFRLPRLVSAAGLIGLFGLAAAANPADATPPPPPPLPPQQMTGIGMSAAGNVRPAPAARDAVTRRPPWITYYYTYEEQAGFDPDTINFPYDKVIMHDAFLQIAFPVYLRPEWRVFSGVDLQWTQFDFQGGGDPEKYSETRNLFACGVPIRVSASLPKDWTGTLMAAPAIYSDMEDVDSGAWRFTGLALGGYRWSPQLNLSAGLAYGRIMGREMPFPVAGLTWDPRPDWRINLMFPNPGITYSPTERLRCMAMITPSGNEWDVRKDFTGKTGDFDLRFKGFRTGLRLEYALGKHLLLRCAGGLVFHRRYELREDGATVAEADVDETWFAQVGLAVR